jgi:molybdopterin synthase sulfur carrier subunit
MEKSYDRDFMVSKCVLDRLRNTVVTSRHFLLPLAIVKAVAYRSFVHSAEKTNMRIQAHLNLQGHGMRNMKVKVHYLGLVKTYTNKTQEDLVLEEGASLNILLEKLAANLGKPFNPEVYDPAKREVKPMFMVLVNGVVIGQLEGVDTKLKDGDTVMVMPLMTGG